MKKKKQRERAKIVRSKPPNNRGKVWAVGVRV